MKMMMKLALEINKALRDRDGVVTSIDRVSESTCYHVLLAGAVPFDMLFKSSLKTYSQKQALLDWEQYQDALFQKYQTLIKLNRLFIKPKHHEDTEGYFTFELEVRESEWSRRVQTMRIPNYFFAECEDFPYQEIQLAIGL